MKKDLKVGIYSRVSMRGQNIKTQRLALRDYCKRNNLDIVDQYEDNGFSGKNGDRPDFTRLLADMRTGRINCIVVYKLDRIGRSLQHLLDLFGEFKNRGVDFISLSQNINTTSPEGRMFLKMLMLFAEFEREMTVERIHQGLNRARKEGKTLGRPNGAKDKKRRRRSGYIARWNGSK